jgi:hypothetical protein
MSELRVPLVLIVDVDAMEELRERDFPATSRQEWEDDFVGGIMDDLNASRFYSVERVSGPTYVS